jgi:hypothetical protein
MRAAHLVAGLLAVAYVSSVQAQSQTPECSAHAGNAERVCAAAVDGTRALHPVFGMLVSGGNPTIGSAATLGGLGHASLTLRANAAEIVLPDLDYTGSSSTVPAGDKLFLTAPLVEGSLGLFGGLSAGMLAVDLLGSAQLLPTNQIDHISVDEDARRVGRTSRSHPASAASTSSANTAAGSAPERIILVSESARPAAIRSPNPPAPMKAASVAVPTLITAAVRMPAMITGAASGSRTCRRTWR